MPERDRFLTTTGNVSFLPSSEVVKTISCHCKLMSATAYRCPENDMHLRDKEGVTVEGQVVPGRALDAGSFRAFANDSRGFDRATWATRMAGRNPTSGWNQSRLFAGSPASVALIVSTVDRPVQPLIVGVIKLIPMAPFAERQSIG